MRRIIDYRWFPLSLGLVGTALIAVSAWSWWMTPPPWPWTRMEQTEFDFPEHARWQPQTLVLKLHNPTSMPARVVGLTQC